MLGQAETVEYLSVESHQAGASAPKKYAEQVVPRGRPNTGRSAAVGRMRVVVVAVVQVPEAEVERVLNRAGEPR